MNEHWCHFDPACALSDLLGYLAGHTYVAHEDGIDTDEARKMVRVKSNGVRGPPVEALPLPHDVIDGLVTVDTSSDLFGHQFLSR
jgi:hypothetical protein